jgi:hypothetical protein
MRWREVVLALALASPGCTLLSIGATSATIGIHNAAVDHPDEWSYGVPVLVSAIVGLVTDVALVALWGKQWAKPMT